METPNLLPDTPSYHFFKELGAVLPTLKCDNGICMENNIPTVHMYLLEHKNGIVNFNVLKTHVCCPSFEEQIRTKANITYEKYKA
jgi:hypothetical protein